MLTSILTILTKHNLIRQAFDHAVSLYSITMETIQSTVLYRLKTRRFFFFTSNGFESLSFSKYGVSLSFKYTVQEFYNFSSTDSIQFAN